jgi:hypothetical protein
MRFCEELISGFRFKSVLIFALHQLIAILGVGFLASTATFFMFDLLRPLNPQFFSEHNVYQVSTRLPYFPVQILEGLWCGWALSRRLRQREMLWVWVLPALILCYAMIAEPNIFCWFHFRDCFSWRKQVRVVTLLRIGMSLRSWRTLS